MNISVVNANYQLPPAKSVLVRVPGESETHFATLDPNQAQGDLVSVIFPQCPLVAERLPALQATPIPTAWVAPPAAQQPVSPDLKKNPEVRQQFETFLSQTTNLYLALREAPWEAMEPATPEYNCIANTLGWKKEIPGFGFKDYTFNVTDYGDLYLKNGFLPLGDLDASPQAGIEKVVIFGMNPQDRGYWDTIRGASSAGLKIYDRTLLITHGARQEENGLYSSKFGDQALIATMVPEDVAGVGYGKPKAIFARLRQEKSAV